MNGIILFAAAAALAGFYGTNPIAKNHLTPGMSNHGSLEPTLWADVPDVAMCRKGGKYYMVSTMMHFNSDFDYLRLD